MGNPKIRKCCAYLERITETNKYFQNVKSDLYKSLDNVSWGVFRTHSEIYDSFLRKSITLESRDFHKKTPSYMFDRVLNTPLVSSLVIRLRGHFVKQNYWRGIRFRDKYWKDKKNFFLAARVINIFFIRQREKQKHYFFLAVDIISKLCSTSKLY